MKRLTRKETDDYTGKPIKGRYFVYNRYGNIDSNSIINKLGSLEDIEEEKKLPLPIYIMLLEDAIGTHRIHFYVKGKLIAEDKVSISRCYVIETDFEKKRISFQGHLNEFPFSEYGKTWALTKEELE